ncbi:unnamed protein product [Amoebophrya sp. A120]|nr:unnamed protein product [Amoebophrya sp. A120]CAD7975672.1 unnamed protein product [Amoebophrya sp. A120]CAD7975678.1 unnamed protein product [Amoebophrya sp. A120]|eukprot:GSA120T00020736001.1
MLQGRGGARGGGVRRCGVATGEGCRLPLCLIGRRLVSVLPYVRQIRKI